MASTLKVQNIQHTGGTDAMAIDSTGRVTTPARPSFRAKPSSTGTIAVNNDLVFADVTTTSFGCHNVGGHYNTSTGIFTCPVDGLYFFQFNVYQENTTDTEVDLFVNSNGVANGRFFATGDSYGTCNVSNSLLLSANDQVKGRVVVGTAYVNASVSSFSGFLIG